MQVTNAPREIKDAIASGLVFDDSGNDVRISGEFNHYDHNGNPEDNALIYRLWDAADETCTTGQRFEVYDDGRVVTEQMNPDGSGARD